MYHPIIFFVLCLRESYFPQEWLVVIQVSLCSSKEDFFKRRRNWRRKLNPPSKAMPLYTPILKKKQLTTERPFFPSSHHFFPLYTHSPGISPAARACNGCLVIKLRQHRIFSPLARHIFMFIFSPSFDHVCNFYGCLYKRCHSGWGMLKGYSQSSKNKNKRSEATSGVSWRAGEYRIFIFRRIAISSKPALQKKNFLPKEYVSEIKL